MGAEVDDRDRGLEHRYDVIRLNDPEGKHEGCRFFVLDPKHDLVAREVLREYADRVGEDGYVELREDIHRWVFGLDAQEEAERLQEAMGELGWH